MASDDQDRTDKFQPDDDAGGYDLAPLPPEDRVDELAEKVHKHKRGKRSRSVEKADEVPSPFTIRQGWLDWMFASTMLPMTLAFAFFLFPRMVPLAAFAAIIAHVKEALENALLTIGFAL